MTSDPQDSKADQEILARIMDEILETRRDARPIGMEETIRRHPHLQFQIERQLKIIEALEGAAPRIQTLSGPRVAQRPPALGALDAPPIGRPRARPRMQLQGLRRIPEPFADFVPGAGAFGPIRPPVARTPRRPGGTVANRAQDRRKWRTFGRGRTPCRAESLPWGAAPSADPTQKKHATV